MTTTRKPSLDDVRTARRAYDAAQQDCPHWDYESDGCDTFAACCQVLNETRATYKRTFRRYMASEYGSMLDD